MGFSDARIATLIGCSEAEVRQLRKNRGVEPVYNTVDTCAAEFEAHTPYLYSTYEGEDESKPPSRKKIMILGRWTESHWSRHRVRLLLRACRVCA